MKAFGAILIGLVIFSSCVPAKRYNELVEKEKQCSEELADYKTRSLAFEELSTTLDAKVETLKQEWAALKDDTTTLGHDYRLLSAKYNKLLQVVETLETNYDKLRLSGAKDMATMQAQLESKKIELQEKEDRLLTLESELQRKELLLAEREKRVNELEKVIRDQDEERKILLSKVTQALNSFKDKGLTVEERNGKIYVSLEASLLFASGSIAVEPAGKLAIINLAKVLESEKDLEVIVEGHTDTDKLSSANHPRNNWELSVLRSTSVIGIMLENSTMNPVQLMAAGRSEFLPVDPNNKAKNRRIEVIISPNLNELYELISK